MRALLVVALLSLLPLRSAAQVSDAAVAQQRFTRGRDLFESGEYATALEEFRAACSLSDSPNARLYLARTQAALHQYGDAMITFELAERAALDLADGSPRYADTAAAARSEREALARTLGRVTIEVTSAPDGLEVFLDGARVPSAALGLAIWVVPGSHALEARADGRAPTSLSIEVSAGQQVSMPIELAPLEVAVVEPDIETVTAVEPAPSDPVLLITGGSLVAVGTVALGLMAPFWVLADDRYRQLESLCGATCPPSLTGVRDEGVAFEAASISLLVVGAGALVVGGVVVLLDAL